MTGSEALRRPSFGLGWRTGASKTPPQAPMREDVEMKWAVFSLLSLTSALIGCYVGLGIQLQLNASLTGNYQRNFLGENAPTFLFTYGGAVIGLVLPWIWFLYLLRRNKTTNSPR